MIVGQIHSMPKNASHLPDFMSKAPFDWGENLTVASSAEEASILRTETRLGFRS